MTSLKSAAAVLLMLPTIVSASGQEQLPPAEPYCQWQVKNYAIEQPLCGYTGSAERGKKIVSDSHAGNCLACHRLPIENIEAFGTIGPSLEGVGSRLSEGFIRLRVVDTRHINPASIMPGFYRDPKLINRPARAYIGRTFLTARQVEDVVAYLVSLK
ncbi:MAG TPA: sulfur oxidation c-type cytochrome SoxX [Gammaproteobacteria bacterium]|nr:sulfur oxidation c-type cytochrome SoxX [Gammaproteobacteria bacterium]